MEEYEDMEGDAFDALDACGAPDARATTREDDVSQLGQGHANCVGAGKTSW